MPVGAANEFGSPACGKVSLGKADLRDIAASPQNARLSQLSARGVALVVNVTRMRLQTARDQRSRAGNRRERGVS